MKNNWKSLQSLIISILIILIISYIIIDITLTKPKIINNVNSVKKQYAELSAYLDKKIPEIDTAIKSQALQLKQQKEQINILKIQLSK